MPPMILVVDDHEIVREGVRSLLKESRPEWEICGEATDGVEAVEQVKRLHPDVVILDIGMPGISGLEAAARISKLGLESRVLLFTMYESQRLIVEARTAGAHGYVMKSEAARHLVGAIDHLLAGGTYFVGGSGGSESENGPPPNPGPVKQSRNVILGRWAQTSRFGVWIFPGSPSPAT